MPKLIVPIRGMHCKSCEMLIENYLMKVNCIRKVNVSHKDGKAEVYYQGTAPSSESIKQAVAEAGYEVGQKDKLPWISKDVKDYKNLLTAAVILVALYAIAKWLGILNFSVNTENNTSLFIVLVVGLVAGVSTCMALVGGLILALSARHAELHPEASPAEKFRPHLYFNLGRIGGYALFGGIIGFIGSALRPSIGVLGIMTVAVGGVMIFLGLKLVEIFPALRDKTLALPSGIAKLLGINKETKEYSHKGAVLSGALTFFLPCGFTQAMQLYAVSTGSFTKGLPIMGLFALGTAPGLLGIGGLSSIFKGQKAKIFFMAAGLAVILLGWVNIANGSRLIAQPGKANAAIDSSQGVQEVRMTQGFDGYSPNVFTVQKGKPVKWIINSKTTLSCASYIVMPKYGISQGLQQGENTITFTPTETGEIPFSCSMGMYTGKFIVVDDKSGSNSLNLGTANQAQQPVAVAGQGSCGGAGGGCGGCGGGGRVFTPQPGTVQGNDAGSAGADLQVVKTTYTYNGDIQPNTFTVAAGKPVQFEVDVKEDGYGCMSTIKIPGLYETPERLTQGRKIVMSFTPASKGDYPITCAMGVQRGVLKVI